MRLRRHGPPPRHRGRVLPKQDAHEILLLLDPPLEVGNPGGGGEDELLRLPHVEHGGGPLLLLALHEFEGLPTRAERALGDLELQVELPKLKIRAGHVGDERGQDRLPAPLARQQARAGAFGRPAEPAPEVEFPRQRQTPLEKVGLERRKGHAAGAARRLRCALPRGLGGAREPRELVRARHAELRPGLEHAGGRDARVPVLLEGGRDELPQLLVLEDLPPFLLAERGGSARGRVARGRPPIGVRDRRARPRVVRADRAPGEAEDQRPQRRQTDARPGVVTSRRAHPRGSALPWGLASATSPTPSVPPTAVGAGIGARAATPSSPAAGRRTRPERKKDVRSRTRSWKSSRYR